MVRILGTGEGGVGVDTGRRSVSESFVSSGNDGLGVHSVQRGN